VKRLLLACVMLFAACEQWGQLLENALDGGGGTGGSGGGAAGGSGGHVWDGGRCESANPGAASFGVPVQLPGRLAFNGFGSDVSYAYAATRIPDGGSTALTRISLDGGIEVRDLPSTDVPGGSPAFGAIDAANGLVVVTRAYPMSLQLNLLTAPDLSPVVDAHLDGGWGFRPNLVEFTAGLQVATTRFAAGRVVAEYALLDGGAARAQVPVCDENDGGAPFVVGEARGVSTDGGQVLVVLLTLGADRHCSSLVPPRGPQDGWAVVHVDRRGNVVGTPVALPPASDAGSFFGRLSRSPGPLFAALSNNINTRLARVNPDRSVTQYGVVGNDTSGVPFVAGCPDVDDLFIAFSTSMAAVTLGDSLTRLEVSPVREDVVLARMRPDGGIVWWKKHGADGDERVQGLTWASGRLLLYGDCVQGATSSWCPGAGPDGGVFVMAFEP
jgi:hypothetical protein